MDQKDVQKMRQEKAAAVADLRAMMEKQTPLKWVDRVIMWCADKMPSFAAGVDGSDATEVVTKALKKSADVAENAKLRTGLITKYGSE